MSLAYEMDFFGHRYAGDIRNVIDFHCFFYGAYEKGHLFFWRDVAQGLFRGEGVFVDIGANVGQHSLFMTNHCSQVHAFEPYAAVRQRIFEKIELNGLANLHVHPVAVGDTEEELPFFAPAGTNLGIGSFVSHREDQQREGQSLHIVKGDAYLQEHLARPVHMMKVDVEGFEAKALTGFRETLCCSRPVLVVEITKGLDRSFSSLEEIEECLPDAYELFMFDLCVEDGRKAKRKARAFRNKGAYRLTAFDFDGFDCQTDLVAMPVEHLSERWPVRRSG